MSCLYTAFGLWDEHWTAWHLQFYIHQKSQHTWFQQLQLLLVDYRCTQKTGNCMTPCIMMVATILKCSALCVHSDCCLNAGSSFVIFIGIGPSQISCYNSGSCCVPWCTLSCVPACCPSQLNSMNHPPKKKSEWVMSESIRFCFSWNLRQSRTCSAHKFHYLFTPHLWRKMSPSKYQKFANAMLKVQFTVIRTKHALSTVEWMCRSQLTDGDSGHSS